MERPTEPIRANAADPPVTVLADDLIWSTRLVALLRSLGVPARTAASLAAFDRAVPSGGSVIVDLTARAYDGIEAIGLAASRGANVLCLAQHDDVATRRAALEAGAARVVPYRTMYERGPETLRRWLGGPKTGRLAVGGQATHTPT
ncbi:MAG TPA: hypothetical protein VNF73_03995 [Candidatus Saccharimonadales bacterium]|nr:hypothetical protein [Candidatus Saccharimonadales bacterium]